MFFSSQVDYGLILLAALRDSFLEDKRRFLNLKKISKENNLPFSYLERVAQKLAKAGLLSAKKGRNGGYALAKYPSKISVLEVMKAIEGLNLTYCSYLKRKKIVCRVGKCCPTKAGMMKLESKILKILIKTNINEI